VKADDLTSSYPGGFGVPLVMAPSHVNSIIFIKKHIVPDPYQRLKDPDPALFVSDILLRSTDKLINSSVITVIMLER
jgi:hypothetical protein